MVTHLLHPYYRGFESQPPHCRVQPWASC